MPELNVVPHPETTNSQQRSTTNQGASPAQVEWYKEPRRPMAEILANLSSEIPRKYLDTIKDKGNAAYIPGLTLVNYSLDALAVIGSISLPICTQRAIASLLRCESLFMHKREVFRETQRALNCSNARLSSAIQENCK